jgi:hypothetical protein
MSKVQDNGLPDSDLVRPQWVRVFAEVWCSFSDGEQLEYTGARTLTQMESFALKAAAACVPSSLIPAAQIQRRQGVRDVSPYELSEIATAEDVFFLFLYTKDTPEEERQLIQHASRGLLGAAHVYKSSSADLFHRYSLSTAHPHLLTFKAHSMDVPYSALQLDIPKPKAYLTSYLNALRMPSLGELNSETSRAYLENVGRPLVALVPLSNEKHGMVHAHLQTLRKVVDDWVASQPKRKAMGKEVIFAWVRPLWASHVLPDAGIDGRRCLGVVAEGHVLVPDWAGPDRHRRISAQEAILGDGRVKRLDHAGREPYFCSVGRHCSGSHTAEIVPELGGEDCRRGLGL